MRTAITVRLERVFLQEFQNTLLVHLVAHRQHMIASRNVERLTIGQQICQFLRASGNVIRGAYGTRTGWRMRSIAATGTSSFDVMTQAASAIRSLLV